MSSQAEPQYSLQVCHLKLNPNIHSRYHPSRNIVLGTISPERSLHPDKTPDTLPNPWHPDTSTKSSWKLTLTTEMDPQLWNLPLKNWKHPTSHRTSPRNLRLGFPTKKELRPSWTYNSTPNHLLSDWCDSTQQSLFVVWNGCLLAVELLVYFVIIVK